MSAARAMSPAPQAFRCRAPRKRERHQASGVGSCPAGGQGVSPPPFEGSGEGRLRADEQPARPAGRASAVLTDDVENLIEPHPEPQDRLRSCRLFMRIVLPYYDL